MVLRFVHVCWTLWWLASTQSTFLKFFRCSQFSEFDSKYNIHIVFPSWGKNRVSIKGKVVRLLTTNSSKTTFKECLTNFEQCVSACWYFFSLGARDFSWAVISFGQVLKIVKYVKILSCSLLVALASGCDVEASSFCLQGENQKYPGWYPKACWKKESRAKS